MSDIDHGEKISNPGAGLAWKDADGDPVAIFPAESFEIDRPAEEIAAIATSPGGTAITAPQARGIIAELQRLLDEA